jgi:hypothetical protein
MRHYLPDIRDHNISNTGNATIRDCHIQSGDSDVLWQIESGYITIRGRCSQWRGQSHVPCMFWRPPRSEDPFVDALKYPVECYFDNDPPDSNTTTVLLHDVSLLQIGGFCFPALSFFYSLILVPANERWPVPPRTNSGGSHLRGISRMWD